MTKTCVMRTLSRKCLRDTGCSYIESQTCNASPVEKAT